MESGLTLNELFGVLPETCPECKGPLRDGEGEPVQRKNGIRICDGCYYEQLGEIIEKNPIVSGRCGYGCGISESEVN